MNKKIKVIDLFKMEKFPKKIKGKKDIYILKCKTNSLEHLYEIDCVDACIGWLETEDISLLDEVEVLEDNTEEIEELPDYNYSIKGNRDKINEIIRYIKGKEKE